MLLKNELKGEILVVELEELDELMNWWIGGFVALIKKGFVGGVVVETTTITTTCLICGCLYHSSLIDSLFSKLVSFLNQYNRHFFFFFKNFQLQK